VVVDTHIDGRGIDTLDVAVEDVLDVVEVVVLSADGIVVGIEHGHSLTPSVVVAHSLNDVSVCFVNHLLHVLGTDADVGLGVVAACIGITCGALFASDLHHTDFTSTASNVGSASAFLERDGGEQDGGDASFTGHGLEDMEVVLASTEDVTVLLEDGGEIL
ncbi:900_t:CDS:1, partial [Acaulospora colombiana]